MGVITKSFSFEVGNTEKHTISFSLSKWIGNIEVRVDGKLVSQFRSPFLGSMPITMNVGDKEKHEVRLQILTPLLFGAFRNSQVQVFVDNKLINTY